MGYEDRNLSFEAPHPVCVYLLERLGQLLNHNASPDESVEGDATCLRRSGWSSAESRGGSRRDGRGSSFKHVFHGGRSN